jgi:hypothetical protein
VAPRFNELWSILGITHDRFLANADAMPSACSWVTARRGVTGRSPGWCGGTGAASCRQRGRSDRRC